MANSPLAPKQPPLQTWSRRMQLQQPWEVEAVVAAATVSTPDYFPSPPLRHFSSSMPRQQLDPKEPETSSSRDLSSSAVEPCRCPPLPKIVAA